MTTTLSPSDTLAARRAMIDSQLRTSGVNEEYVLSRMLAVAREEYLPQEKASLAYIDRSIIIGEGAHLASPLYYGKLLTLADIRSDDRVLVVEAGTSYLADLAKPLAGSVDTLGAGDAAKGPPAGGSKYSLLLVDGAIDHLPAHLADSIEEGGRIVCGLILRQVTRIATGRKISGAVALQPVEDIGIPVLHAFDKPKGWTF